MRSSWWEGHYVLFRSIEQLQSPVFLTVEPLLQFPSQHHHLLLDLLALLVVQPGRPVVVHPLTVTVDEVDQHPRGVGKVVPHQEWFVEIDHRRLLSLARVLHDLLVDAVAGDDDGAPPASVLLEHSVAVGRRQRVAAGDETLMDWWNKTIIILEVERLCYE